MGYNISEVSGEATGGPSEWTFTIDLSDPTMTTVTGDFNVVSVFTGNDLGEAQDGYAFSELDTLLYGSLSSNSVDGTFSFTVDRAAVFATGADQVVSFSVTGTSAADTDTDVVTIEILVCVARGTLVETTSGPVSVEDIRPGQMVTTKDNGAQPVRWIGSRLLTTEQLSVDASLRPIRISRGALGQNMPLQDLIVSPQHRVFLSDWRAELMFGEPEVLVPAKALVNDASIRIDESLEPTEYFHLMFDDHQVIFTDGAPTESFFAGPWSLQELGDAARVELQKIFPELFEGEINQRTVRMSLKPWEGTLLAPQPTRASRQLRCAA